MVKPFQVYPFFLQEKDFTFVLDVLTVHEEERKYVMKLLCQDEEAPHILDDEALWLAVKQSPEYLNISTWLYFYLSLRQPLLREGIYLFEIASYLALVLSDFVRNASMRDRYMGMDVQMRYSIDLLDSLQQATGHQKFASYTLFANRMLLLTGWQESFLRAQTQYRGAPSLSYYEGMGSQSFVQASRSVLAREYELDTIFTCLAAHFSQVRLLIRDLRDQ